MRFSFRRKRPATIDKADRWIVELDGKPVAMIANPVDADTFWFTWELEAVDETPIPDDLWDYANDTRRSFRHVTTGERTHVIPAGREPVLPNGRVMLRGPLSASADSATNEMPKRKDIAVTTAACFAVALLAFGINIVSIPERDRFLFWWAVATLPACATLPSIGRYNTLTAFVICILTIWLGWEYLGDGDAGVGILPFSIIGIGIAAAFITMLGWLHARGRL